MRPKRFVLWSAGILVTLVVLALAYFYLILDREGRPYCHVQVHVAFMTWMDDHGMKINSGTNSFPNVNGISRDSLATISELMNHPDWPRDYKYVPGLREDDPGDLVLMYIDRPTRWVWHGRHPTIFKEKAWIVVPIDFTERGRPSLGPGEKSERISSDQFRSRLRRTLEFVRTNERPNWQTIVAEHTKFLDSIEHVEQ